jgi:hypothetical protein
VYPVPEVAIDDRDVLVGIALAFMRRLAKIDPVREHSVEQLLLDRTATLRADALAAQLARSTVAEPVATN